jgi:multiple sugar transport system substrate-binding protein
MKKPWRLVLATALTPLLLAGCGDAGTDTASSGGKEQISYWLWDANQLPAYTECATAFQKTNPNVTVKIEQYGWADYWSKLTTSLVSGDAPDVFTDHLNYYPTFAEKNQILAIDDMVAKDGVKTDIYAKGLADLWVGRDGKRYGLPKDFDTVALFYNAKMLKDAGVDAASLSTLAWNPTDGGSYEKLIAHLTIDTKGKRGDEAGFDKAHVKTYGLGLDENQGAGVGQQMWSMYALSTGWNYTDKNPWGTHFNYDDPKFQQAIGWWRSLIAKGYMPSLAISRSGTSVNDGFGAGKYALSTNGSWMIGSYFGYKGVQAGVAPLPVGPDGKRATIFNGLADSIYAGTKHKDAAWQWVKFLGSADCQKIVGGKGVVFPAIPEATTLAEQTFKGKNVDVSAFTDRIAQGETYLYPITEHAPEIAAIMNPAMDAVLSFKAEPASLTEANKQVNALFQ